MSYLYSPEQNAFFAAELEDDYRASGTWPEDAIPVSDEIYDALIQGQMDGKIITHDDNGQPVLIDPPPPSHDELVADAENNKYQLLLEATDAIAPLQDAVDLDIATDAEIETLKAWKKYRVLVNRVDTSKAPKIKWPEKPAS
ncbi:tail fiber assembly protein [Cronobacter turicensis]|uniref:tail fiber assembly protein n=1 Tax=Cronobacter turicensis TaxID=413502 RepID=UPI0024C4050B|nr:tail fiber assembly protein [Cronobacter turicensis]MDK1204208.1 tail fiber assembly protein [Cronobacter turicensis]MDK1214265.1 tail fiber assembly protein [Cronobacter turicensis]MDK1233297.1 tail fiber assembly protein [Cronobacter turicensis]